MHQQLQELLNMSACVRSYSHRGPWRLSGENICCPSTRLQRRVLGRGAVMRSAAVGYFWIMPVNAVLAERWKYSRAPGEDLAKHVHLPDCDSPDCQKLWQRKENEEKLRISVSVNKPSLGHILRTCIFIHLPLWSTSLLWADVIKVDGNFCILSFAINCTCSLFFFKQIYDTIPVKLGVKSDLTGIPYSVHVDQVVLKHPVVFVEKETSCPFYEFFVRLTSPLSLVVQV